VTAALITLALVLVVGYPVGHILRRREIGEPMFGEFVQKYWDPEDDEPYDPDSEF
jgi:hypothetical protein